MIYRINLVRVGKYNGNYVHSLVVKKRTAARNDFIEIIGSCIKYPNNCVKIDIDHNRATNWIAKGAYPTRSASEILSKTGIVPPTPHELRDKGLIQILDPRTWDVEVKGENDETLGILSAKEAREAFEGTKLASFLPKDVDRTAPEESTLSVEKLTSIPRMENLSNEEKLKTLRAFLGF